MNTNSGDTEPTTTFANQLWIDTANNVLKIRNEGNTDWVATGLSITADNTFIGTLTASNANIILNYSTGDSSSTANGAGITIQDAVSVGNDASLTWNTNADRFNLSHGLDIPDNALISIGDGDDLRLSHNGTASKILNYTGHLDIQNLADGQDLRFGSDDGTGSVENYFRLDGGEQISVASKNIRFEDNVKSTFGDSDDLEIYHDGTNSFIDETSAGSLRIRSDLIELRSSTGEVMIEAVSDGGVSIRHDNVEKLATTANGIEVNGTVTSDVLTVGTSSTTIDSSNHGALISQVGRIKNSVDVAGGGIVSQAFGTAGEFRVKGDGDLENTNNSYGAISDEILKENIADASPKLEKLKQVQIKTFNLIDHDLKQIGVIAQDLENVFPSLVKDNDDGYKTVKYSVFVPILIKAMQELEQQVADLSEQVQNLQD